MSDINNYSRKPIKEISKNFEFLLDNSSVSQKSFNLEMKLSVSLTDISMQAKTFATNYSIHGYLIHSKVLRCRDHQVHDILYKLYIYSFVKSIYNSIYFNDLSESSNLGLCFSGHCALFYLLRSRNNSHFEDDFMLSYRINTGSRVSKQALILRFLSRFTFLAEYAKNEYDSLGTSPFIIPKYEEYLNRLQQDHYAKDHISQGGKSTSKEDDKDSKVKPDNKTGINYYEGKLEISRLNNNSDAKSILSFNNSPVMNSFLNINNDTLYFIPVGNNKKLEFNRSFSFNKANQLKVDEDNTGTENLQKYYKSIPLTMKQKHLTCSEVFTNTGIKCRTVSELAEDKKIFIPSIEKIIELINLLVENKNIKGKTFSDIVQMLIQRIIEEKDGIDFDNLENLLLENEVK